MKEDNLGKMRDNY